MKARGLSTRALNWSKDREPKSVLVLLLRWKRRPLKNYNRIRTWKVEGISFCDKEPREMVLVVILSPIKGLMVDLLLLAGDFSNAAHQETNILGYSEAEKGK